jgi:uncharacterized protein YbjT (DUF2867 family)
MAKPLILVTGATGTVGGEVLRQLVQTGERVRALARTPEKAKQFGKGVEVVIANLEKPETLDTAFAGAERVFVVAPTSPALQTIEGNSFDAAKNAGARHIVNLSNYGAGAFGPPVWDWHGASEARLKASGVAWTILRPARFMPDTPFPWNWSAIKEQSCIFEATGDGKITTVAPVDI